MIKQKYDLLLHLISRQTNLNTPYSDYIGYNKFPEQNTELINTEVTIKYRNHYTYTPEVLKIPATIKDFDGKEISSRPPDDMEFIPYSEGPETLEQPDVYTGKFKVIRADNEAPYVLIGISTDYNILIISSSEKVDEKYKFESMVEEYPIQVNEFLGVSLKSQYFGDNEDIIELDSVVLRLDETEPCKTVIMEYMEDNTVRFTLGDEHYVKLSDSKLTTNTIDRSLLSLDTDLLGIYITNWSILETTAKKDAEIAGLRKELLEGKINYGTI